MVLDLSELKKPETTEWRFRECNGNFLAYSQGKNIDMKSVKRDVLVSDPEREIVRVRHGADSPKDGDLSMVSIFDAKTDSMLMRWYEKTVAYDCDDVLTPTLMTYRVGPAEYYNPDGTVAGLEFYNESFDIKNPKGAVLADPDRLTHVYFHPEGGYMSGDTFDVRYCAVLESLGLSTVDVDGLPMKFEFCPRIDLYNQMVCEISSILMAGVESFSHQKGVNYDYLVGRSDAFYTSMAVDIKRRFNSMPDNNINDEFLSYAIDQIVYSRALDSLWKYLYANIEVYSENNPDIKAVVMVSSDLFFVCKDDCSVHFQSPIGGWIANGLYDSDFKSDLRLLGNLRGKEYFAYVNCESSVRLLDGQGKSPYIPGLDYSSIDALCESFDSLVRKVQTLERLESGQGNGMSRKL